MLRYTSWKRSIRSNYLVGIYLPTLFVFKELVVLNKKYIIIGIVVVVLSIIGYVLWDKFTAEEVTGMSQTQAETEVGVKKASENAHVTIDTDQAKQVAERIQIIRETKEVPVYVEKTTGKDVEKVSKQYVKDSGADFAIVTDAKDKDKEVSLKDIPEDSEVVLNQYNINSYKKYIQQVEVGKSTDGYTELGYTINKKITDDGKYIGIGVSNEWNSSENRTFMKFVYSW